MALFASVGDYLLVTCGIDQLGTGDVAGVSIIAFRWFSQMDISGNVVVSSNTDHINTLKVCSHPSSCISSRNSSLFL